MTVQQTISLSIKISLLASLVYLLGLWLLTSMEWHLSSAIDWLFRGVLVFGVVLSITLVRGQQNGFLGFKEGMRIGSVTTLLLSIGMSIVIGSYVSLINPTYVNDYRQAYTDMQYEKTMRTYIYETYKKDTMTQGAVDTVTRGVNLYMGKIDHFFTRGGQIQITFGYAIAWGILTTLTAVLFARRAPECDEAILDKD